MADDADIEEAPGLGGPGFQGQRRLVDDVQLLVKAARDVAINQIVQADDFIGDFQGAEGGFRVAFLKAVDVGAAQRRDQRPVRIKRMETLCGGGAAPAVACAPL